MKSSRIFVVFCSFIFLICHYTKSFSISKKKLTYIIDLKNNICHVKEYVQYKLDNKDILENKDNNHYVKLKKILPLVNLRKDFSEKINNKNSNFELENITIFTRSHSSIMDNYYQDNKKKNHQNEHLKKDKLIFNNLNIMVDFFTFDNKFMELNKDDYYIKNFTFENKNKLSEKLFMNKNISIQNGEDSENSYDDNHFNETSLFDGNKHKYISDPQDQLFAYDLLIANKIKNLETLENKIINIVFEYEINSFFKNKPNDSSIDSHGKDMKILNMNYDMIVNGHMIKNKNKNLTRNENVTINADVESIFNNITKNNTSVNSNSIYSFIIVINENSDNIDQNNSFEEIKIYIDTLEKDLNYSNIIFPEFSDYDLFESIQIDPIKLPKNITKNRESSIQIVKEKKHFKIELKSRHIIEYIYKKKKKKENSLFKKKTNTNKIQKFYFELKDIRIDQIGLSSFEEGNMDSRKIEKYTPKSDNQNTNNKFSQSSFSNVRYKKKKKYNSSGWEGFIGLIYILCLCFMCVQCYESCCSSEKSSDSNILVNHDLNGNAHGNDDFIFICN